MSEDRRHPRVREAIEVRWKTLHQDVEGRGTIRNISISGVLLEVDQNFKPADNDQFIVESTDFQNSYFVPRDMKLVWYNRNLDNPKRLFCGMKFINASGPVLTRLVERIEERLSVFHQAMDANIIQHYLSQSN